MLKALSQQPDRPLSQALLNRTTNWSRALLRRRMSNIVPIRSQPLSRQQQSLESVRSCSTPKRRKPRAFNWVLAWSFAGIPLLAA